MSPGQVSKDGRLEETLYMENALMQQPSHIYTYLQVTWADVLDFYIRLDQERSKATVFQPLHHDGDFKAAQHSR